MLQQRKAVSGILRWCESQDGVKVTGNAVFAAVGEHLDWVRKMIMSATRASDCPCLLSYSTSIALLHTIFNTRSTCSTCRSRTTPKHSGGAATTRRW